MEKVCRCFPGTWLNATISQKTVSRFSSSTGMRPSDSCCSRTVPLSSSSSSGDGYPETLCLSLNYSFHSIQFSVSPCILKDFSLKRFVETLQLLPCHGNRAGSLRFTCFGHQISFKMDWQATFSQTLSSYFWSFCCCIALMIGTDPLWTSHGSFLSHCISVSSASWKMRAVESGTRKHGT